MPKSLSIGIILASAILFPGTSATAPTAIGLVRASGEFVIDSTETRDNSTVFDGSVISTAGAASHVVLDDGTRIDMGPDSRSRIYRDHLVIEQGLVHLNVSNQYAVLAGRIRIESPEQTLVRVTPSRTVEITSVQGVTNVKNGSGILIAMVPPGRTLDFGDSDAPSEGARVTGCLAKLESKSGHGTTLHYVLEDQTTNVVAELVGTGLDRLAGYTVEVTGSIDLKINAIAPASYVIRIGNITSSSGQRCTIPPGIAAGSRPPAAVAYRPLGGIGGVPAVVAGVAVWGTLGILTAGGVIDGGAAVTSPSPASR